MPPDLPNIDDLRELLRRSLQTASSPLPNAGPPNPPPFENGVKLLTRPSQQELDALPTWIKAIMRTMNENLREANKKIKMLENTDQDTDRFPPHVINKLISIINFVGLKYGQKDEGGTGLLIPAGKIRNYTIQIFQEATNKMESMQDALKALGFLTIVIVDNVVKAISQRYWSVQEHRRMSRLASVPLAADVEMSHDTSYEIHRTANGRRASNLHGIPEMVDHG